MSDEKKHKSGFALLKEKLAKAEAENKELRAAVEKSQTAYMELTRTSRENMKKVQDNRDEWKKDAEAKQTIIEKQGTKISQLSGDLSNAQSEAREYRSKFEEAVRRMGWLRRLWYGYDIPQFTNEDHWHD